MKYIFIVNPYAGKEDTKTDLIAQLKGRTFDYEIYNTKKPTDATVYAKTYCMKHPKEEVCFIACGGDGTLNEVVNGIYGYPNAYVTVFPCGSGNDYAKYYGGAALFKELDNILEGEKIKVDVMEVNGQYSINVVNFGLDCIVLNTMQRVKRLPILGGENSYKTGVVKAVFVGRRNKAKITVDGEIVNPNGLYCLCTIANGTHVGGSYKCAPLSIVDDGMMEVCVVEPVGLLKFLSVMKCYKEGRHFSERKCNGLFIYRRAKKIVVDAPEMLDVSVDGEIQKNTHFEIINHEKALNFIRPKGALVRTEENIRQ